MRRGGPSRLGGAVRAVGLVPEAGRHARGQTMIGLLVSLVIILLVLLVGLGMMKTQGVGKSTPARVESKARGLQCQTYLQQMRMMALMNNEEKQDPTSLEDFRGAGELRCPVCGMRYFFNPARAGDPQTRGLYCPYPEHWDF